MDHITDALDRALLAMELHTLTGCVHLVKEIAAPDSLTSSEAETGWRVAKQQILEALEARAAKAKNRGEISDDSLTPSPLTLTAMH